MWNPRVGGEKPFLFYGGSSDSGSPPRGRGKDFHTGFFQCRIGITPAWAGKRGSQWQSRAAGRDHPRMGGEKITRIAPKNCGSGSPPRGRGKDAVQRHTARRVGITPAWAGKRLTRPAMTGTPKDHPRVGGKRGRCCPDRLRCWDHPRVGGEKLVNSCPLTSHLGSPPHGRGKVSFQDVLHCDGGITPAWAGKRGQHFR